MTPRGNVRRKPLERVLVRSLANARSNLPCITALCAVIYWLAEDTSSGLTAWEMAAGWPENGRVNAKDHVFGEDS